jgi:hypothetical protein
VHHVDHMLTPLAQVHKALAWGIANCQVRRGLGKRLLHACGPADQPAGSWASLGVRLGCDGVRRGRGAQPEWAFLLLATHESLPTPCLAHLSGLHTLCQGETGLVVFKTPGPTPSTKAQACTVWSPKVCVWPGCSPQQAGEAPRKEWPAPLHDGHVQWGRRHVWRYPASFISPLSLHPYCRPYAQQTPFFPSCKQMDTDTYIHPYNLRNKLRQLNKPDE